MTKILINSFLNRSINIIRDNWYNKKSMVSEII